MRYYLPKTRFDFYRTKTNHHVFVKPGLRRYKRKEYWRLLYAFWFWIFLEFAAKVGFGSILPIQDLGSYFANLYSQNINVPKAKHTRNLPGHHHVIYISLDKNGIIKINGITYKRDNLSEHLLIELQKDRQIVTSLIVDKNVEMYEVNWMLNLLRKTGLRRINFMCTNK